MHYFQFEISRWRASTRKLTVFERGVYLEMLHEYYDTEKPLPLDHAELFEACGLHRTPEQKAAEKILAKHFKRKDDGYHQAHADEKIGAYKRMVGGAKNGARARWDGDAKNMPPASEGHMPSACPPHNEAIWPPMPPASEGHMPIYKSKNQESKNPEIRNLKTNPPTPKGGGDGWDDFWAAYPRKVAKPAAVKAWAKLAPDAATCKAILAAIAAQKKSPQWTKDDGQFIPHPATWLNRRQWEDDGGAGAKRDPLWPYEDPTPEQARRMLGES